MMLKVVSVNDLRKGDLVVVKWIDASELRLPLDEHRRNPEASVKDWGVYAGISGRKLKLTLLAKDMVERHGECGVTRIPLKLIQEIMVLESAEDLERYIPKSSFLARRVKVRKHMRMTFSCAAG
jgi:hypothetical protein